MSPTVAQKTDAPAGTTVYVVATTPEGTASALREARRRALPETRMALLVPLVTSFAAPHGAGDPVALMKHFGALALAIGVNAVPYVCVCQRPEDIVQWFELDRSTVIIGGRCGRWWRLTEAQRLARDLTRRGLQVIFAEAIESA